MTADPLVMLWHDTRRPLQWHHWQKVSAAEQARLRSLLMEDLRDLDAQGAALEPWAWRSTHRHLLELKAASGHARDSDRAASQDVLWHAAAIGDDDRQWARAEAQRLGLLKE